MPAGRIAYPAFLPDATFGVVRSLDAADLDLCGVPGLVMSTFHLMRSPGSSTIRALGGLHQMAGWTKPIITDSGGFQAYSLLHGNPLAGSVSAKGLTFRPEGAARPFHLSPEKTVQLQLAYGADVVVCLDDCRHPEEPDAAQAESVARTIDWARRGRREFDRLLAAPEREGSPRPRLFAVIQGGASHELRRRCAQALLEMGFDGFGYGGWPLTSAGDLLEDALAFTRELVPRQFPLHALGVGHPHNVARAAALGYELFDSALPTRDARQGRLCALEYTPQERDLLAGRDWFHYVYARDAKHNKARGGVYEGCACYTCTHYSLGYLHHLLASGDGLFARLASIHNLTFMSQLMGWLRSALSNRAIAQAEAAAFPRVTAQPKATTQANDIAEPDDTAEADDIAEPDDIAESDDAVELDDIAPPEETATPDELSLPDETAPRNASLPSVAPEATALAAAALATAKYRHLAPELAQSLAADVVLQQAGQAAVKAVRSKLHQAACSFQRGKPTYDAWLTQLRAADSPERLRDTCRAIMAHHASTYERLPELDRFYDLLLPDRERLGTVLDAGCGFHPLGLPFMDLAPGARYIALDVMADLVKFLNRCWPLLGVDGRAEVTDLARHPEALAEQADVALLLKLLPTLEQIRFGAGAEALAACRAPTLVISFPARSLGGRQGGLARPYERWFLAQPLVAGAQLDRFELPSELVFVLRR